jgi:DNA-directed RNA polymerase specialized sigma24 family protein
MSSGYVIPVDPSELANRFAAPDAMLDDDREESSDEMDSLFQSEAYEKQIMPLLDLIPDREADLIYLYYVRKKRQADIALIFNVTQAAISYRLDRGIQRIKFLLSIPRVSEEDMRDDLAQIFEEIDINILVGMWQTTCQSEVAAKLKLTQGRVRHRFFKAVETLKKAAEDDEVFEPYSKIFSSISQKNFNILRAVELPQWANRGVDRCV